MSFLSKPQNDSDGNKFKPKTSWMQQAEYNEKDETMIITFANGSQYKYIDVDKGLWKAFQQSPDHGSYYSRAIKGRVQSVPIMRKPVGQKRSTPLKKDYKPRRLNTNGLNIGNASKRPTKQPGTIPFSFGK